MQKVAFLKTFSSHCVELEKASCPSLISERSLNAYSTIADKMYCIFTSQPVINNFFCISSQIKSPFGRCNLEATKKKQKHYNNVKFPGVVAVLCIVPSGLVLHIGITSCTFPPWTEMSKKNRYEIGMKH